MNTRACRAARPAGNHRTAMSILEVAVAGTLIAVTLLALVELLPSSIVGVQRAQDLEAATAYGAYMLEDARLNSSTLLNASPLTVDVTLGPTAFHVVRASSAVAVPSGGQLINVVVTMSGPRSLTVVMGTRVASSGP